MTKELIICVIIIALIFAGDIVTQNYTKKAVEEATQGLNELREELIKDDVDSEILQTKISEISDKWNGRHKKLAYYIEHDEIEKVETDLSGVKGNIEVEEYSEATVEVDKTIYVLEHIKNKNIFNLENIF